MALSTAGQGHAYIQLLLLLLPALQVLPAANNQPYSISALHTHG